MVIRSPDIVDLRIEKELTSILGNGFAVIYLASQMLVHRSNERGYLVDRVDPSDPALWRP